MNTERKFQTEIWKFYKTNKRDFPWRRTRDPYRILISEIMLQQTQTARVVPFYNRFTNEIPDFSALVRVPSAKVLRLWQGLGYNRRALYLKRIAKRVAEEYGGKLPNDPNELCKLPGIGTNTAGAICAYAFNKPVPFVETNIRKAFIHFFFAEHMQVSDAQILEKISEAMDTKDPREWYYAVVDFGAHLGKKRIVKNERSAHYRPQSKFEGSNRELRAKILRMILGRGNMNVRELSKELGEDSKSVEKNLLALTKEGFLSKNAKGSYSISNK